MVGGRKCDFFVDLAPRSITVRKLSHWSDEVDLPQANMYPSPNTRTHPKKKTVSQLILEQDTEEDDELSAMLADEIAVSSSVSCPWRVSPILPRAVSPLSDISSSSSNSYGSPESYSPPHPIAQSAPFKMLRREQARWARVFVDSSKTEVTPYDGGKTMVLTGGVMLGGGRSNPPLTGRPGQTPTRTHIRRMTPDDNDNWHAIRF